MTEPTDSEILDAADDFRSQYMHGGITFDEFDSIGFARAVLAKWGTPAPVGAGEVVAWVDERAIGWLQNSRAHSATITTTLGKAKSSERPMPLHGTPQPTQPQAGAVPPAGREPEFDQFLSDVMTAAGLVTHGKQCKQLGERLGAAVMKLRAHGIKGGQHGTDTDN